MLEHPEELEANEIEVISTMTAEQLDALPFGAIKLDADGYVLNYNAAESKLTGRDPKRVIGSNFFRVVAPCTNVREFAGCYRDGVAEGRLHVKLYYRFDFDMDPVDVVVTLFYDARSKCGWVFVRSLGPARRTSRAPRPYP